MKGVHVPKVLILDARSYAAAVANRAKGGGCECPGERRSCFNTLRIDCYGKFLVKDLSFKNIIRIVKYNS